jgi:hypothetical protein
VLPVWQTPSTSARRGLLQIVALFLGGTSIGGTLTGLVVASVVAVTHPSLSPTVGIAALTAVAVALLIIGPGRLPQRRMLIPRRVVETRTVAGIVRFGVEYGSGVRTLIVSIAPHLVVAGLLLRGVRPLTAVLAGTAFGIGKGLHITGAALSRDPVTYLLDTEAHARIGSALVGPLLTATPLMVSWLVHL